MKKYFLMIVSVLSVAVSVAFAGDTKEVLRERAARINAEYNIGKMMVEKAPLEEAQGKAIMDKAQKDFEQVQQELKALESKPTTTASNKKENKK